MQQTHHTLGFFQPTAMAGLAVAVLLAALPVRQATAFCFLRDGWWRGPVTRRGMSSGVDP
jgi:hypothetical protein